MACPGVVRRCLISEHRGHALVWSVDAGKFDVGLQRGLVLNLLGKGESWLFAESAGVAGVHDNS